MKQVHTANLVDVFASNGLPSAYLSGKDLQDRYGISPATFWRWKKDDNGLGFPKARFGEEKGARWALEDVIEWEKNNAKIRSRSIA